MRFFLKKRWGGNLHISKRPFGLQVTAKSSFQSRLEAHHQGLSARLQQKSRGPWGRNSHAQLCSQCKIYTQQKKHLSAALQSLIPSHFPPHPPPPTSPEGSKAPSTPFTLASCSSLFFSLPSIPILSCVPRVLCLSGPRSTDFLHSKTATPPLML